MTSVCTAQTSSQYAPSEFVFAACNDMLFRGRHNENMPSEEKNYLRQWREKKGLTQEELAEKAETTKAVISLLENEKRPLSSKWLRKFADALGTTPGRILDVDPGEVSAEVLDIWDHIRIEDRAQAVRVLRSLTGTHD
jgi:transcriptional regulator with XRE-family HTH domain